MRIEAKNWNAQEALFAFCGWLTTRDNCTVMGANYDAAIVTDRIREFVGHYKLPATRKGWENAIRPMKTKKTKKTKK